MGRPIKAHLVNRSNRPVNRSKPVALELLNSNLNPTGLDRFPVKPVRYTGTGVRRFDRTGRIRKPCPRLHRSLMRYNFSLRRLVHISTEWIIVIRMAAVYEFQSKIKEEQKKSKLVLKLKQHWWSSQHSNSASWRPTPQASRVRTRRLRVDFSGVEPSL